MTPHARTRIFGASPENGRLVQSTHASNWRRKEPPDQIVSKKRLLNSHLAASVYAHARLVYKFQLSRSLNLRLHVLSVRRQHYKGLVFTLCGTANRIVKFCKMSKLCKFRVWMAARWRTNQASLRAPVRPKSKERLRRDVLCARTNTARSSWFISKTRCVRPVTQALPNAVDCSLQLFRWRHDVR